MTEAELRYAARAVQATRANPHAISTCHSHQVRCQLRESPIATSASASSTQAAARAAGSGSRRLRYSSRYRHAAKPNNATPGTASAISGPCSSPSGGGPSSGGSSARETIAQTASPAITAARMARSCSTIQRAVSRERVSDEPAAKQLASTRPIGVAITKPTLRPSTSVPGVASACSPRKPAETRNASETRNARASRRRRAASLAASPSTTLTSAVARISQKWLGPCCQWASADGTARSMTKPATGSSSETTATLTIVRA